MDKKSRLKIVFGRKSDLAKQPTPQLPIVAKTNHFGFGRNHDEYPVAMLYKEIRMR
jgi:hypothetical protein